MELNKNFINRVIREKIVDTEEYRYIVKSCRGKKEIRRLPIWCIGKAMGEWETVAVVK